MITSHQRGHAIIFINNTWVYLDDKTPAYVERRCIRCNRFPIKGIDACLGKINNAVSACCGHGVEKGYIKK